MTDAALIDAALRASGLSARRFATRVVWCDERTLRGWRAGRAASGIPATVRERLAWLLALDAETRAALVAILDT